MQIGKLEKLIAKQTRRERTDVKIKALVIFLYFNGLSLRAVSAVIEYLVYNVSHEAIRKWVHSLAKYISNFYVQSDICYVDETKIKKKLKFYRFGLAVNEKGKALFCWLSSKFYKEVTKLALLNTKIRKIVTDKAPLYPAACKDLGLEWKPKTFGKRNSVEMMFMPIKKEVKKLF